MLRYGSLININPTEKFCVEKKEEEKNRKMPWKNKVCENIFILTSHVLSMINSTRPTVPPVAIIILFVCFVFDILKSEDGRTDEKHVQK